MSAVSNVLAGGMPGFAAPQNAPNPAGPLGPAPQPVPQTPIDADYAPLQPEAAALDPYVLETPVKIRILGSSRMLARPILAQQFQFLAPLMLSGPFLQQLALQGESIDMAEFFRLAQDATGLGKTYKFVQPMTLEQQQARSQPPPEVAAQLQKAQLDNQGRAQAVQAKQQTDQLQIQTQAATKQKEIDAADARHILTLAHKEKESQASQQQAPHQQLLEMLKGKQDLQQSQQQSQQQLQAQAQTQAQKLQFAHQTQQQKLAQQVLDHRLQLAQTAGKHQQQQTQIHQTAALNHATTQASNRQDLMHQSLMNLMARQQKEHEMEQARKLAAQKPVPQKPAAK